MGNSWIGDGECDVSCNIESCHFDGGDCTDIDMCADGCIESWIGDGECDVECYNTACKEDGGDCELDPADDAKPCECTGQQNVMDLVAAARIGTRIPVVPGATHHKVHAQIKCLHGGVVCIIHTSLVLESHRHQRWKSQ